MFKIALIGILATSCAAITVPSHSDFPDPVTAVVHITDPLKEHDVHGFVKLTQTEGRVHIEGEIRGLRPGHHGFHIHRTGHIGNGCSGAGPHYNPLNTNHGPQEADAEHRHWADFGNIEADKDGVAIFDFWDPIVRLTGKHSVIGRALNVHADKDDLGSVGDEESLKSGHSGHPIACGVVAIY
nr:unnamed protein product [Callosobruchus chinensis]